MPARLSVKMPRGAPGGSVIFPTYSELKTPLDSATFVSPVVAGRTLLIDMNWLQLKSIYYPLIRLGPDRADPVEEAMEWFVL